MDNSKPVLISDISIPPPDVEHLCHLSWLNESWILLGIHGAGFLANIYTKKLAYLGKIKPYCMDGSHNRYVVANRTKEEIRVEIIEDAERIVHEFSIRLYNFIGVPDEQVAMALFAPKGEISVECWNLAVAANPLGTDFAIALDHCVEIRNCIDLKLIHRISLKYWIEDVRFSPSGEYLIVEYADNDIDVIDTLSWKTQFNLEVIGSFEMYADKPYAIISERTRDCEFEDFILDRYSKGIVLLDLITGEEAEPEVIIKQSGEALDKIRSSSNGEYLAAQLFNSSSERKPEGYSVWFSDGQIRIWKLPSFTHMSDLRGKPNPEFHTSSINPLQMEFSPDSSHIAVMFNNQTLSIWKMPKQSHSLSDFQKSKRTEELNELVQILKHMLVEKSEVTEEFRNLLESINTRTGNALEMISQNQQQILKVLQLILKIDFEDNEDKQQQLKKIQDLISNLDIGTSKRKKILEGLGFIADSGNVIQMALFLLGML